MLSHWRTRAQCWWHQTILPDVAANTDLPTFQKWHQHNHDSWSSYLNGNRTSGFQHRWSGSLHVISWNIDAGSPNPGPRIAALLRSLEHTCTPDIVFFQEVSKPALETLLADSWIQSHWLSSEADASKFGKQAFATVTLISKSCLANHGITLGPIWRIPLPSRFGRDALCCDILLNGTDRRRRPHFTRLRLINVHLDSLPIHPSCRPQQLSIVAEYLRVSGRGLVAGDFNPVLPEDEGLVEENGLVDAWTRLRPTDPGYTWGVKGDQPFPPNRLDKVAMYNLGPSSMRVLPACHLDSDSSEGEDVACDAPFSDHLGLSCVFTWSEGAGN